MLRTVVPEEPSLDALARRARRVRRAPGRVEPTTSRHCSPLGVPDLRLATLPAALRAAPRRVDAEQRFRDAVPQVATSAIEWRRSGSARPLQHDDLHDGQVFVRDGRHRSSTGATRRLAPVLHALGDARGRARLGARRRGGRRRHRRRSATSTSRPSPRPTRSRPRGRRRARPAARAGCAARQRPDAQRRRAHDDPAADVPRPNPLKATASGTFDPSRPTPAHLAWERVEGGSDGRVHAQHRCVRTGDGGGRPAALDGRHRS